MVRETLSISIIITKIGCKTNLLAHLRIPMRDEEGGEGLERMDCSEPDLKIDHPVKF